MSICWHLRLTPRLLDLDPACSCQWLYVSFQCVTSLGGTDKSGILTPHKTPVSRCAARSVYAHGGGGGAGSPSGSGGRGGPLAAINSLFPAREVASNLFGRALFTNLSQNSTNSSLPSPFSSTI